MNKRQNELENQLLNNEKQVLDKLKENYAKALSDIKRNIKSLTADELTKSKIYQLEYQKIIYKQVSSVINYLRDENITNITDYLKKSYEDSFIGTLYNMQGEGVPLIFNINQSEVLSIINKSTEDFQLSKTLYKNANKLKTTLQNEISRGISNGSPYIKIAQQLSNSSEADLHQSYRIARTEGGRVQSEAKYKSMQLAKDNGADIVKQWDSAMDRKTRKSHRELDGQIRELDEPFEIGGHSAMYPRGFSIASEDVNCRCTLLERARWALDESEIEKLNNENKIIIKTNNYNDFKKEYYKKIDMQVKGKYEQLSDLNINILGNYKNGLLTEEFVLTQKQLKHIIDKHPQDYKLFKKYEKEIINNPDYILEDIKNKDTLLYLKTIDENSRKIQIVVKLATEIDGYKNSLITLMQLRDRTYNQVLKKNTNIVYKKE